MVGRGSAPDVAGLIDLFDGDEVAAVEPAAKRARLQSHAEAGPSEALGASRDRLEWAAPFALLRAQGIPEQANKPPTGMRLSQVVCGQMQWVLASNFEVDLGWLLSACPDLSTAQRLLVVHGESHPAIKEMMRTDAAQSGMGTRLAVHAPPLPIPYGTHHSKAFVIEYATGLRVVVHTANLIHADNNYKAQGLWVQDFPPKDASSPDASAFGDALLDYMSALGLPADDARHAKSLCRSHDFSSARSRLIASTPGYHQGPALKRYGHVALKEALSKEAFDSSYRNSAIFAQFSSMGSLDSKWLHDEFEGSLAAGRVAGGTGGLGRPTAGASALQLIWPTVEEVQNSNEGWAAGRSIPGPSKNVGKPFLHTLFHRYSGAPAGRQRAMPHIKSYGRYVPDAAGAKVAWLLLASHNLSKAAWGTLQKKGSQLMIRSYELGVLLLPSLEAAYRGHRHCGFCCTPTQAPVKLPDAGVCERGVELRARQSPSEAPPPDEDRVLLPLPFPLPPQAYVPSDQPWTMDGAHPGVDSFDRRVGEDYPPLYGYTEAD